MVASIKALKHSLAVYKGDARPVVFNLKHGMGRYPQNHIAALRRMGQCVVHQIA